jgi:hypothetical protein
MQVQPLEVAALRPIQSATRALGECGMRQPKLKEVAFSIQNAAIEHLLTTPISLEKPPLAVSSPQPPRRIRRQFDDRLPTSRLKAFAEQRVCARIFLLNPPVLEGILSVLLEKSNNVSTDDVLPRPKLRQCAREAQKVQFLYEAEPIPIRDSLADGNGKSLASTGGALF